MSGRYPTLGDHWAFENIPDRPGIQPGLGGTYRQTSVEFYRSAELARLAGWTVRHVRRFEIRLTPPADLSRLLLLTSAGGMPADTVWLAFRTPRTLTLRQCPGASLGPVSCRGCTAEYLRQKGRP
jgi:hypothetical protein